MRHFSDFIAKMCIRNVLIEPFKIALNQLLQLCTARTVFSILVTVRLYSVMVEVCCRLTNEKQRKTDRHVTDQ